MNHLIRLVIAAALAAATIAVVPTAAHAASTTRATRIEARGPDAAARIVAETAARADAVVLAMYRGDGTAAAAYARHHRLPLLYVDEPALTQDTKTQLARLKPKTLVVIGQESSIASEVVSDAAAAAGASVVKRMGGIDRFATAAVVAAEGPETEAVILVDFNARMAHPLAVAQHDAPILLTPPDFLHESASAALGEIKPKTIIGYGVSDEAMADAAAVAGASNIVTKHVPDTPALRRHSAGLNWEDATAAFLVHDSDAKTALAASAVAGGAVLYTGTFCVDPEVVETITRLAPDPLWIVGDKSQIWDEVAALTSCAIYETAVPKLFADDTRLVALTLVALDKTAECVFQTRKTNVAAAAHAARTGWSVDEIVEWLAALDTEGRNLLLNTSTSSPNFTARVTAELDVNGVPAAPDLGLTGDEFVQLVAAAGGCAAK